MDQPTTDCDRSTTSCVPILHNCAIMLSDGYGRLQFGLWMHPEHRELRTETITTETQQRASSPAVIHSTMRYATFLLLGLVLNVANGQVITVLRNGQSFFHYDVSQLATLVETNSSDYTLAGDTILLPGGTISIVDPLQVNKQLTIVGAGMLPTGTPVTTPTTITSLASPQDGVQLTQAASGVSFHGINFDLPVTFVGVGLNAPSFSASFVRCGFDSGLDLNSSSGFGPYPPAQNVALTNCVVRGGIHNSSVVAPSGLQVNSCFITGAIDLAVSNGAANTSVNGCIILGNGILSANPGVQFTNNIFTKNSGTYSLGSTQACYTNNLFATQSGATPAIGTAYCAWNGNAPAANAVVFQNVADFNDFNANFDYHTQAAYQNYGVYAGVLPWKEGGIPFNPHWDSLLPVGTLGTTNGGTINVTIQGSAQQN